MKDQLLRNVDLRVNKSNHHQSLYASMAYNTFFGIFGKLEMIKKGGKDHFLDIELKLINYKGILDVQFKKNIFTKNYASFDIPKDEDGNLIESTLILNINVGAYIPDGTQKKLKLTTSEIDLSAIKKIDLSKIEHLIVNRHLISFYGYPWENLKKRIDNNPADLIPMSSKNGVHDEEFFYRNGPDNVLLRIIGDHALKREVLFDSGTCHQSVSISIKS